MTGPRCDIPCEAGAACDFALYCHSWGATHGLSTFGAYLFTTPPESGADAVLAATRRFIVEHASSLGLAPGLSTADLGLRAGDDRRDPDRLRIFRFDQTYRGIPVFGADAQRTVLATDRGVLGLRGAVIDARTHYRHADAQAPAAQAAASLRAHASEYSGVPEELLTVGPPRLVAVPRAHAIGWTAPITRGLELVAIAVVEADPTQSESLPLLPLLYYWDGQANGLLDETPVEVHAELLKSDVFHDPVEAAVQTALFDGSPLLGSLDDAAFQLATDRVAVVDASGLTKLDDPATGPVRSDSSTFVADPGTPLFRAHSWYVLLVNLHAYTDTFMAGRWESTRPLYQGEPSLYPPGQFHPRIVLHAHAPEGACKHGEIFCYAPLTAFDHVTIPELYKQPADALSLSSESLGGINIESNTGFSTILHEFGHAIDDFAKPGLLDFGLACTGAPDCQPSCAEGSTDEVAPLRKTWAQLASIWLARALVPDADASSNCDVLLAVSHGTNRSPHHPAGRPDSSRSVFLRDDDPDCPHDPFCIPSEPDCTQEDVCDRPADPGFDAKLRPTGQCRDNLGYRTDSVFQAVWELLHAESCADAEAECTPLTSFGQGPPATRGGDALLYALRVGTSTYRGFADDLATHVACNHGAAAYAEVNEVLCHHRLRDCDAPVPVVCPLCGDGRRDGDESCDGDDLGDAACHTLGFDAGALACADDCTFDVSDCSDPVATSNGPDTGDVPTLGGEASSASTQALSGDSESAGGVADAHTGCGCRQRPPDGTSAVMLGLGGLLARRRRRAANHLAPLLSLALGGLGGCVLREGGDSTLDDTGSTGTGSTTDEPSEGSETGVQEVDPRFFGAFHGPTATVGFVNDGSILHGWGNIEVRPDGHFVYDGFFCTNPAEPVDLTWKIGADPGTLELEPNDGETIRIVNGEFSAVRISLAPDCGDLVIHFTRPEYAPAQYTYHSGRVCAQGSDCEYELVWCDGEPPLHCGESEAR